MPRKSQVNWFKTRNAYYTQLNGKQIRLAEGEDDAPNGPTFTAALAAYKDLLNISQAETSGNCNTVRTVCELYARHLSRDPENAGSLTIFLSVTKYAIPAFGDVRLVDLKPFHIQDWLNEMAKPRNIKNTPDAVKSRLVSWDKDSGWALRTLKMAFNWAKKVKYITQHPFGDITAPASGSRGEEAVIDERVFDKLLATLKPSLRELLTFCRHTGCRPDEAYHLEARYYDPVHRCVLYKGKPAKGDFLWKNAKRHKGKKDRIIYLNDELVVMVEALILKRPTGLLFKSSHQKQWTGKSCHRALAYWAEQLSLSPVPTMYGIRHTYATNFLLAGGSIKILADLMGTSVAMLERHYAHLNTDKAAMRNAMMATMEKIGTARTSASAAAPQP